MVMRNWWQRRSLKVRLALWYAAATTAVLTIFAGFVFEVVEHRLAAEMDRQLRIDFDLVEAQLATDATGKIRWPVQGAHGDEGFARLSAWFEVWSESQEMLLRHWPVREADIRHPLPAPVEPTLRFHTTLLEEGLPVRLMERPARVLERGVIIRVIRDETEMRRTLRQIVEVFILGVPLAVCLASLVGYLVARRSLQPVAAMAAQARTITSESLSLRLPNSNPQDELGQLATVFNATLQHLENSFAELKRFTADASHELRTPLTALRSVGEVGLRQPDDPAALRETIGSMLEEAQRLDDLIDALLTLARMESGKQPVHLESVPMESLLADVRESLEILAEEKQQVVEWNCTQGLVVSADRLLLRQALLNIVHNAIRYAPRQSRITIKASRRDTAAVLEVADEGPGIAAEHHQKIFDRFYRVDKARSRAEGGSGLGLAIAKWSVHRQGGQIAVESEAGKGSTFRIVLPARLDSSKL
jgi:heavy metal sensor kinase